ncbi:MAG: hypothetical protein EOO90_24370 [Pedobacter sp.]|nr:MAG: hypothetical protein EOO90_24370 [Pedobacter sp.]
MILKKYSLATLAFLYLSCSFTTREQELEVINFKTYFDITLESDKPNLKETFDIKIVRAGKIRCYIIPTVSERSEFKLISNGVYKEGEVTHDTTYSYHMIENGYINGLKYDSLTTIVGKEFKVDSLLDRINIGKSHQLGNSMIFDSKLVSSSTDKKNGKLISEKYVSQGASEFDTLYRYYDYSMNTIEFSLAPLVDKKTGTKLVKLIGIKNPRKFKTHAINRECIITEFERTSYKNPSEILALIEKFKRDKGKLQLN